MFDKYEIATGGTLYELVNNVIELIKDGWQPIGGMTSTQVGYCQAVGRLKTVVFEYTPPEKVDCPRPEWEKVAELPTSLERISTFLKNWTRVEYGPELPNPEDPCRARSVSSVVVGVDPGEPGGGETVVHVVIPEGD